MVDIPEPSPLGAVIPEDRSSRRGDGRHERSQRNTAPVIRKSVSDVAFVMGIPMEEFTPRVEEALSIIMAEFDRQRMELERGRDRVAFLEEQADTHSFLPVANRRAFLRELSVVLTRAAQTETRSTYGVIVLANAQDIRNGMGRAALDVALIAIANALMEGVRGSDAVGSMGGGDFGVILVLSEGETARAKIAELALKIEDMDVRWLGRRVDLKTAWGLYTFDGSEAVRTVLDSTERALLEEFGTHTRRPPP